VQPQEEIVMTLRSKLWRVLVVLFILVNWLGAGYAAAQGELLHAGLHAGLLFLAAYLVSRGVDRPQARL